MYGDPPIRGLKGSWEWLHFAAQLPSSPQFVNSQSASGLVYSGRCILTGATFLNSGTAPGQAILHDGLDLSGGVVSVTPIAANAAGNPVLPAQGILCEIGVFLEVVTATLKGGVFVIPLWHYDFTEPGD